jgi:hypothetical protein
MRLLLVLLVILSLGACKDRTEKAQFEIKEGNKEGQQMRKKYEDATKQAEEQRKKAEQ